jgi:hypothetical protein
VSTQTTRIRAGEPGPDEGESSVASRLPEITAQAAWATARAGWAHRWRLAPFYLASCTVTGVGMGHGLGMAGGLGAAAVAAEVASRTEVKAPDGRMLLSGRERRLAAIALAGTGAWAGLVTSLGMLPWFADAGLLAGALAWPTHQWWASRRPLPEPEPEPSPYSPMAQHVLSGWVNEITVGEGPRMMRGSVPVLDTLTEPAEDALTIEIQLPKGVAAKNVVSEANRRHVEALFGFPEDTVRLETVRDDSTRFRAMITASRHLEVEGGLDWPGPVLHENGQVPLAVTGGGAEVAIPLFEEDGIRHGYITGTTRTGKSVSSVSVLVPGVNARIEVILYLDGKRGTSAPYLRPIIARYARMDEQWPILIEIAYRILQARENRRGALGLHEFHAWEEDDPIITIFIDEPNSVKKSRFFKAKHERMVLEILEHGGALGVRLIQCGQSPAGEDLIGGVQARGLMSGGWSINHRAGGKGASRLTLDSTNENVSLLELPKGGAAITVAGRMVGHPAQVRNATKERVLEEIQNITPRELSGDDLAAAGPEWHAAHWEDAFVPGYTFDATTPARPRIPAQGTHQDSGGPGQDSAGGEEMSQDDIVAVITYWVMGALQKHGALNLAGLAREVNVEEAGLQPILQRLIRAELVLKADDMYVITPTTGYSPLALEILTRQSDLIASVESVQAASNTAQPQEPDPGEDDLPASRLWVLDQLEEHPEGLSLGQLAEIAKEAKEKGEPGAPSRRTITNSLAHLMGRSEVARNGAIWFRVQAREAVDEPLE